MYRTKCFLVLSLVFIYPLNKGLSPLQMSDRIVLITIDFTDNEFSFYSNGKSIQCMQLLQEVYFLPTLLR